MDENTLMALTTQIVAAHVAHNPIPASDIPALIASVRNSLESVRHPIPEPTQVLTPAVAVKKSITNDHIICLEDGKKMKMLKRHLQTVYGMTPDQYRAKWGLDSSYPMVAPSYAERRSTLAKQIGLGRKPVAIKIAAIA